MGRSSQRVWPGNQYFLFFPTLFFEPTCVLEIDNGQRSCTTTFPDEKRGNEQKQGWIYHRLAVAGIVLKGCNFPSWNTSSISDSIVQPDPQNIPPHRGHLTLMKPAPEHSTYRFGINSPHNVIFSPESTSQM